MWMWTWDIRHYRGAPLTARRLLIITQRAPAASSRETLPSLAPLLLAIGQTQLLTSERTRRDFAAAATGWMLRHSRVDAAARGGMGWPVIII